jgi:hypothetical protein
LVVISLSSVVNKGGIGLGGWSVSGFEGERSGRGREASPKIGETGGTMLFGVVEVKIIGEEVVIESGRQSKTPSVTSERLGRKQRARGGSERISGLSEMGQRGRGSGGGRDREGVARGEIGGNEDRAGFTTESATSERDEVKTKRWRVGGESEIVITVSIGWGEDGVFFGTV